MKILSGYFIISLFGLAASQSLLSLIQTPSRRVQLSRTHGVHDADTVNIQSDHLNDLHRLIGQGRQLHNLGIHDADHVNIVPSTRARASSSASSSVGLPGLDLSRWLGAGGSQGGHVTQHLSRSIVGPRTVMVSQRVPGGIPGLSTGGFSLPPSLSLPQSVPAGLGSPMFYDRNDPFDPSTPDTPDLVYAPRSMMGNLHQVEAYRNHADADGVVFV